MKSKYVGILSIIFTLLLLVVTTANAWESGSLYGDGAAHFFSYNDPVTGAFGDIYFYEQPSWDTEGAEASWSGIAVTDGTNLAEAGLETIYENGEIIYLAIFFSWADSSSQDSTPYNLGTQYYGQDVGIGIGRDGNTWSAFYNVGSGWSLFDYHTFGQAWAGSTVVSEMESTSGTGDHEEAGLLVEWYNVNWQLDGDDWYSVSFGEYSPAPQPGANVYCSTGWWYAAWDPEWSRPEK